jgi:hypothetical protein
MYGLSWFVGRLIFILGQRRRCRLDRIDQRKEQWIEEVREAVGGLTGERPAAPWAESMRYLIYRGEDMAPRELEYQVLEQTGKWPRKTRPR